MVGKHGQGGGLGVGIFDTIKEAAAVYQRRWCYNGIEGGGIGYNGKSRGDMSGAPEGGVN